MNTIYRAQVQTNPIRTSPVFTTEAEADAWLVGKCGDAWMGANRIDYSKIYVGVVQRKIKGAKGGRYGVGRWQTFY